MSNAECWMISHSSFAILHSPFHEAGRLWLLTWACWRWGLPCHDRHRPRGALLPHLFTLTLDISPRAAGLTPARRLKRSLATIEFRDPSRAVCFLWHYPSAHAGLALPTTVPCPVRTFLPDGKHMATLRAIAFAHSTVVILCSWA